LLVDPLVAGLVADDADTVRRAGGAVACPVDVSFDVARPLADALIDRLDGLD
jgi:hypothetical protein